MISQKLLSCSDAKNKMVNDPNVLILDVRNEEEYKESHIPNSVSLPLENMSKEISKVAKDKSKTILVYCSSGKRSTIATDELTNMGYTNVFNMGGISVCEYDTVKDN